MLKTFAVLFLCSAAALAGATPASAGTWMNTGQPAIPPAGFLGFCMKHLPECRTAAGTPDPVELTDERRHDLDVVQADVNGSITPREDPKHTWDYSADGYGDCYAPAPMHCPTTGRPWVPWFTGPGHVWPLLNGERGEQE